MYQPLPDFAPLFPPVKWWRVFMRRRMLTENDTPDSVGEAIKHANKECGMRSRDWMRFAIADGSIMSMPVEGGASTLKNRHPDSWSLSGGALRQARKFDSTMATLYGRSPFFHYLGDPACISGLLATGDPDSAPLRAEEICSVAFHKVSEILSAHDSSLLSALRLMTEQGDRRLMENMDTTLKSYMHSSPRLTRDIDSVTVLDPLFRLGPDAIFLLLPTF